MVLPILFNLALVCPHLYEPIRRLFVMWEELFHLVNGLFEKPDGDKKLIFSLVHTFFFLLRGFLAILLKCSVHARRSSAVIFLKRRRTRAWAAGFFGIAEMFYIPRVAYDC